MVNQFSLISCTNTRKGKFTLTIKKKRKKNLKKKKNVVISDEGFHPLLLRFYFSRMLNSNPCFSSSLSIRSKIVALLLIIFLFRLLFFLGKPNFNPDLLQVRRSPHTRLCTEKNMLMANGQFPGPTIHAQRGDLIIVDVINSGDNNITIHR